MVTFQAAYGISFTIFDVQPRGIQKPEVVTKTLRYPFHIFLENFI